MRHHPSLEEVLAERCSDEWIDIPVNKIVIRDWANAENKKGDITNTSVHLRSGPCTSEHGTFSFGSMALYINHIEEDQIQNLIGESPLGMINYYEESCPTVSLNLTTQLMSYLLPLVANDLNGLSIRVSIPIWSNKDVKCLPLMDYQVAYEKSAN
jgi:hypothetical protein